MSRSLVIGLFAVVAVFTASIYLMILVNQPAAVNHDATALASRSTVQSARSTPTPSTPHVVKSQNSAPEQPVIAAESLRVANQVADEPEAGVKLDVMSLAESDPRLTTTAAFDEANRAYDSENYDQAKTIALRLLGKNPDNPRLMRIVVSSACILGDASATVADFYRKLPPSDQAQMKVRCERYGITFK